MYFVKVRKVDDHDKWAGRLKRELKARIDRQEGRKVGMLGEIVADTAEKWGYNDQEEQMNSLYKNYIYRLNIKVQYTPLPLYIGRFLEYQKKFIK